MAEQARVDLAWAAHPAQPDTNQAGERTAQARAVLQRCGVVDLAGQEITGIAVVRPAIRRKPWTAAATRKALHRQRRRRLGMAPPEQRGAEHAQATDQRQDHHGRLDAESRGQDAYQHAADRGGAGKQQKIQADHPPAQFIRGRQLQPGVRACAEHDTGHPQHDQQRQGQRQPAGETYQQQHQGKDQRGAHQHLLRGLLGGSHDQRRDERADAHGGGQQTQAERARVERIARQQRQHGGEVVAEGAHDCRHRQGQRDIRRLHGKADPIRYLPQHLAARRSLDHMEFAHAHDRQTYQHRNKTCRVKQKRLADTHDRDHHAGDRGSDHARRVKERAIERYGVL